MEGLATLVGTAAGGVVLGAAEEGTPLSALPGAAEERVLPDAAGPETGEVEEVPQPPRIRGAAKNKQTTIRSG